MADGGEGTLDALGGANRTTTVTGPLGDRSRRPGASTGARRSSRWPGPPGWSWSAGPSGNDPVAASTAGTGELIVDGDRRGRATGSSSASVARPPPTAGWPRCGRSTRSAGCGASSSSSRATSARRSSTRPTVVRAAEGCDAGAGRAAAPPPRAAGAGVPSEHGVDVLDLEGAGAAGGLAGGLAAAGARLVSGFDLVADEVDLDERIEGADLVVTGEGFLDEQSFEGKVVGGVVALAGGRRRAGRRDRRAGVRRRRRAGRGRSASSTASARSGPVPTRSTASRRSWTTSSPGTRHDLDTGTERGIRDRRPQPPRRHGAGRARPRGCRSPRWSWSTPPSSASSA